MTPKLIGPTVGLLTVGMLGGGSASAQTPSGVLLTSDVDYVAGTEYADGNDLLDVYVPEGSRAVPVLVYFHGGLLTMGDKSEGAALAEQVVPLGVAVVSANYRLSPDATHPAHVEDAASAVAWVRANIERFGGDPERIFVGGWSAGAYLVALMAVDDRYLGAHGMQRSQIRGWIPISPFLYVEETARDRSSVPWGDDPDVWLTASVSPYIAAGVGPMLLIYGDGDDAWRKEQNDRFAAALRAAGNHHVGLVEVPNRTHTGLVRQLTDEDDRIVDLVVDFVKADREPRTR